MQCPYYDEKEESCGACSVEVRFIECARLRLCTGKKYEACPVYFVSFFFGPDLLANAHP